uniref:putative signal transducing protein n=1 Tax=Flavobacterium sp. TaxID=239 RepID=UPI0040494609
MELITIKTFDNLIEAHLIKSKLESENIMCFLFDENIVGLNPLYNITVGGIKLKVNKSDIGNATNIIEACEKSALTNDQGEVIKCPKCESEDIYSGFKSMKGTKGILSTIVSFMFIVFPIYYKTVYKCKNCNNEFK